MSGAVDPGKDEEERINMFEQGSLWESLIRVSARALRSGAQLPMPSDHVIVEDRGIPFVVRILSSLERKRQAREEQDAEEKSSGREVNPFLPYEEELFVAHVSDTHLCLLNKFNVLKNHLLIVTRSFEDQERLLTLEDFHALWICMGEFDSLGFYNGGEAAGASQRHKHLQLVPLPMTDRGPRVPVEPALVSVETRGTPGATPRLPFVHAVTCLPPRIREAAAREAAVFLLQGYLDMLKATVPGTEGAAAGHRQAGPYNLLVTREWMLLVPRSREFFGTISVNALGFAGGLLVRNGEEMKRVREAGPMEVLRSVGVSR
jgi:ATP adenylyltransferase